MKPLITIALQCHNFQKRFCWMLSSIAQQTNPELVRIDVAHMPGNGNPTTEALANEFHGRGFELNLMPVNDFEFFQKRGLLRNVQMKSCTTEWMMFGDSDMVYPSDYFVRLAEVLDHQHPEAPYMLSSGRTSQPGAQFANALVDGSSARFGKEVVDAFARAATMPKKPMRNCGAGFCQIVNMRTCPHDGYYVKPEENRDWNWSRRGSNPKSDMQFRRRVNKSGGPRQALPQWFDCAIHLNHNRDPEAGHHLTEQR